MNIKNLHNNDNERMQSSIFSFILLHGEVYEHIFIKISSNFQPSNASRTNEVILNIPRAKTLTFQNTTQRNATQRNAIQRS